MLQHGKNTSFPRKATLCKFDKILYKQNYKIKTSYKNIRKEFIPNILLLYIKLLLLPRRSFPPFPADASCRGREGDLRRPCRAAAAGRGMKRKKKARIHKEEGKDTRPQIMPALPCPQTFPFSVSRPLPCRRIFLHYSRPGTAPPAGFPLKRPSNASFTRRTFR